MRSGLIFCQALPPLVPSRLPFQAGEKLDYDIDLIGGIKVGTVGTLERILFGPAHVTDGSENLIGALRQSMAALESPRAA